MTRLLVSPFLCSLLMYFILNGYHLDFTEHQRSVFCVFSGTGVNGLRRFLNTKPEFAEYQDVARPPRRRSTVAHGGDTTPGPILDMDGIDEADGVEDDDMGDGSELALDTGNFHQPTGFNNTVIQSNEPAIPPPPPFHHPPAAGAGGASSHHTLLQPTPTLTSYGGATTSPPINGSANAALPNRVNTTASPQGSLDQVITTPPASTAPTGATVLSTAGASIFGNASSSAGPSTASLQGPARENQGANST